MWPIDHVGAPEWIERQPPRTRVLLTFVLFTFSCWAALRGFLGFSLAHSLFDAVGGGLGVAAAMVWRDRRRGGRGAETELHR